VLSVLAVPFLVGEAVVQAAGTSQPILAPLKLKLPRSFEPINELIGLGGRLWLFSDTGAVSVDVQTGVVKSRTVIPGTVTTAPVLGPNGEVWFGGLGGSDHGLVGEINSQGVVRSFALPAGDQVDFLASGQDGNVWVTLLKGKSEAAIARVSPTGQLRVVALAPRFTGWGAPLVPAAAGGFWTTVRMSGAYSVAYISLKGEVRLRPGPVLARAIDSRGVLWGWGPIPGYAYRSPPTGMITRTLWYTDSTIGEPLDGDFVLASDDQLWFTGATIDYSMGSPEGYPIDDQVIGTVLSDGSISTWRVPYSDVEYTVPGEVDRTLLPGFDGRLYALAGRASKTWQVVAITLPDHPQMEPTKVSMTTTRTGAHSLSVRLRCTGRPGRFCAGTIKVSADDRLIASQPYAITPGLETVRAIGLMPKTAVGTVKVSVSP
jgi:hypothetical protein